MTVRWLHISDVHECNRDDYQRTSMFEAIVAAVKEREPRPDFVFFTGDLAFSGSKPEYDLLRDRFLNPLCEALPDGCPIFTVPGNHDVDRTRCGAPRIWIEHENGALNTFQKVDSAGLKRRTDLLLPRFEAYREIEQEFAAWDDDWLASETGAICVTREAAGHKMAIVGINTAWLCHDDQDWGRLTAGETMVEAALNLAKDADLTVVLGHHPLAAMTGEAPWSDGNRIRLRLQQAKAIYLHGHLHKSGGEITTDSLQSVLAIQAPSGFQAANSDRWRNGIMWGEADTAGGRLIIEPLRWNNDYREFVFDSDAAPSTLRAPGRDAFAYPLPGQKASGAPVDVATPTAPDGWQIIDAARLAELTAEKPSAAEMADWFNGSFPIWEVATARGVRPRPLVDELLRRYRAAFRGAARPFVRLLTGAGGEGKSAALMQLAASLLRDEGQSWTCLWRQAAAADLPANLDEMLQRKDGHAWIIAIDDAEGIGEPLCDAIAKLEPRTDVHVILAAREADWTLLGNTDAQWQAVADFQRVVLSGIDEADARCIAETWAAWGDEAMGHLRGSSVEEAARALHGHAREFATRKEEGALLGALLMTREGEDYRQRVARLMEPLREAEGIGQHTLLTIYAMIVAMHAENQLYLSRPVLAHALNCEEEALDSGPLLKLRREAMLDGSRTYLLTRHRLIAEVARDWLIEWGFGINKVYPILASAATRRFLSTRQFDPDLGKWNYGLSEYFLRQKERGKHVAVNIAHAVWQCNPANPRFLTSYASVLREAGHAPAALKLLAENAHRCRGDRSVLYEWGVTAGEAGDYGLNAWLAARALADDRGVELTANQSKRYLAGLGKAFEKLTVHRQRQSLIDARAACGRLGLLFSNLNQKDEKYLSGHSQATPPSTRPDFKADIKTIRDGAIEASHEAETENTKGIEDEIDEPDSYYFTALEGLISQELQDRFSTEASKHSQ